MSERLAQFNINTRIRENAENLAAALDSHMPKVFAPDAHKELRRFSAGEAAEMDALQREGANND